MAGAVPRDEFNFACLKAALLLRRQVREALRRHISRGHVSLSARIERAEESPIQVDEARFAAYVAQLKELGRRHGLAAELDLATVLRLPGVVVTGSVEEVGGSLRSVATAAGGVPAGRAMGRGQGHPRPAGSPSVLRRPAAYG